MIARISPAISSLAASLMLALATLAQTPQEPPAPSAEFASRLAALSPDRPAEYMLLAEEVADARPEDPTLARTLFVLAFHLQRDPAQIDAAPVIALASMERHEPTRRWLLALAGSVDRRYTQFDWSVAGGQPISDDLAYKAATVLGLARAGDGREARRLLGEPGVKDLLTRYERAIPTSGQPGALTALEQTIALWPCPECGNTRYVSKSGPRGLEVRLCPTCRGNPGPQLARTELIDQLRFEAILLNGIQRSWAAQALIDQGAPLRDPDPADLPALYAVDPDKPLWRDGQWVSAAKESKPKPPPRDASPPATPAPKTNTVPAPRPPAKTE